MGSAGRRTSAAVRWGGALFAVFFAIAWVTTCFYTLWVRIGDTYFLDLDVGAIWAIQHGTESRPWPEYSIEDRRPSEEWRWWPEWTHDTTGIAFCRVAIPLWVPVLGAGVPSALLWRGYLKRRRLVNGCQSCGYDLAGLPRGVACPECGNA